MENNNMITSILKRLQAKKKNHHISYYIGIASLVYLQ